jgi:hypothetical protein
MTPTASAGGARPALASHGAIALYDPLRPWGDDGGGAIMSAEIETAAAGGLGGFFRFRARKSLGEEHQGPCANCGTPMLGPWCYACGQSGEEFHRSIVKLLVEVFEGLFHFDGRVWRTLPDLFRRPAHLTRSYLDGHRAPQIPPLRLFLVVLLAVFFAASIGSRGVTVNTTTTDDQGKVLAEKTRRISNLSDLSPTEQAAVRDALAKANVSVEVGKAKANVSGASRAVREEVKSWWKTRLTKTFEDPERFKLVLEQWSERFAFLTLPLATALLSLLFMVQRQFYIFDHTIFSLHSLSATGLLLAVTLLLSKVTDGHSQVLLLAAPVHLFFHMRGVYRTSVIGTLLRMGMLFIGSVIGGSLIFLGLLMVGLSSMGA